MIVSQNNDLFSTTVVPSKTQREHCFLFGYRVAMRRIFIRPRDTNAVSRSYYQSVHAHTSLVTRTRFRHFQFRDEPFFLSTFASDGTFGLLLRLSTGSEPRRATMEPNKNKTFVQRTFELFLRSSTSEANLPHNNTSQQRCYPGYISCLYPETFDEYIPFVL